MINIGITGTLSSGKSTVAKLISGGKYPLFSADLHDPEGCSSGKLSCEEELPELGGFPSFEDLPS